MRVTHAAKQANSVAQACDLPPPFPSLCSTIILTVQEISFRRISHQEIIPRGLT
jgi:hypothetical protein